MRGDLRALLAAVLLAAPGARAAGFAVAEQGAEAFGLAGAATARLDLAEVAFYNPAAWARRKGLLLAAGGTALVPSVAHVDPESGARTSALAALKLPPYLYAAYGGLGDFAAGLAAHVPFGSGLRWPEEGWAGRFEVTETSLAVYEVAPSLAWRPMEVLSVAAGPRLLLSTVGFARQIDAVSAEASVRLGGQAAALGGQAALLLGPFGPVAAGLTYRSRADLRYEGAAHFEGIPVEMAARAHDQAVRSAILLPDRVALGASLEVPTGAVSLDLEYTAWSTFQSFAIDFADEATPDVAQPRNWHDTLAFRAGYEHRGLVEGLALRGGLAFDPTPAPPETLSPSAPDGDRLLVTLGASYDLGSGFRLSGALGQIFFLGARAKGEEVFAGAYEGSATALAVGVSYRR